MAIQDFIDRIRVRQGESGTAGMWLYQTGPNADRAFVGMVNDNKVGLWGSTGAGWGFHMDTTTGNVGIGAQDPGFKLDVADRIRLRQGKSGTAGMWLYQTGPNADRAFVGMVNDNKVGLWGSTGAGWGFHMDTTTGNVGIGAQDPGFKLDVADRIRLRQGKSGTAGMWLYQTGAGDQAFIGMKDNNTVGLWGSGRADWGLVMNTSTGQVIIGSPPFDHRFPCPLHVTTGNGWGLVVANNSGYSETISVENRGGGRAASFRGDVFIKGRLINSLGQSKIDHPLDPDNQYLSHSVMESDEMKNVYDGMVELDANGEAEIQLSSWCEALNHLFRYQLTPIGSPAPDLHVAQECSANRLRIAGGRAGMTVCWQVTGVRRDAYAQAHPLLVEDDKPAGERGYYLHPELYGQPAERSVEWARNHEQMRLINERSHPDRVQLDGDVQADAQPVGRE